MGDGSVQLYNNLISWTRTLEIKDKKLKMPLRDYILSHPKTSYHHAFRTYRISGKNLKPFSKMLIQYMPKMLNQEITELKYRLGIVLNIQYRANYYVETDRVTITWQARAYGKNAKILAQFIKFPEKNAKIPWLKSHKARLLNQILKI